MYAYFSLVNVLGFAVVFTFIFFIGRKAYRAYKGK